MKSTKKTNGNRSKDGSDTEVAGHAPTDNPGDLFKDWNAASLRIRLSWLAKPRLHTAIFEQFLRGDLRTDPSDDAFPSPETKARFYQQRAKLAEEIAETQKQLEWDDQRLEQFATLVVAFRKDPSIDKYLAIRQGFPEVDIQIGISGGIDPLIAIEKKCKQYDIDPRLVAGAMDGFEPSIDNLCLVLMDRIIARDKITGVGALDRRRAAIPEAMVNYLIAFMLEGTDWADEETRLPASLILLIRHQLGALKGDLHRDFESREAKLRAAQIVGQQTTSDERLSINRLVKLMSIVPTGLVSRATAARWLKDEEFLRRLEFARELRNSPERFDLKLKNRRLTKKNVRDTP